MWPNLAILAERVRWSDFKHPDLKSLNHSEMIFKIVFREGCVNRFVLTHSEWEALPKNIIELSK